MTINEILSDYVQSLQMTDGIDQELNLKQKVQKNRDAILNILKYLDYKESGGDADGHLTAPYCHNVLLSPETLWMEISNCSLGEQSPFVIELPELRRILEKYKILNNEKNGLQNIIN